MKIIVNCIEEEWEKKDISYEELAILANLNPEWFYSASWYLQGKNQGGILHKNKKAKIKKGIIFNIFNTGDA